MPVRQPIYSIDASALIEMKSTYPISVFRSLWDFVGKMGDDGRLFVTEPVKTECKDDVFKPWFADYNKLIVPFSPDLNNYVNALQMEINAVGLPLVDPSSTKNQADPFVVALALMVEKRSLSNLQVGSCANCCVVSYEKNRNPGARLAKIKDVCEHYNIGYLQWPQLLQRESWSC